MKTVENFLILFILSFLQASFSGCSNDDQEPGCFKDANRKITATITNISGTIHGPKSPYCTQVFTIEPFEKAESRPLGLFDPCNLTEEYQVDGAKVIFSGYVYESFDTEDICADFFEITEIRFDNQ